MSNQIMMVLIVTGVLGIIVGFIGGQVLQGKNVNMAKILNDTSQVATVVKTITPSSSMINNVADKVSDIIKDWGVIGAGNAEQLCKTGKLTKEQRNEAAKNTVYTAFKKAGIKPDEDDEKLISDVIEYAVGKLDNKSTPTVNISPNVSLATDKKSTTQDATLNTILDTTPHTTQNSIQNTTSENEGASSDLQEVLQKIKDAVKNVQ